MNETRLERSLARKKKTAVFLLVFIFYLGLATVDNACSEFTRHKGALTLQSRRVSEDYLSISFLGREALVNTSHIIEEFHRVTNGEARFFHSSPASPAAILPEGE